MIIHKYISVIAMTALLTACGGGDGETVTTGVTTDNSPQEEGTSSNSASMLVDTSGGVANIPATVGSSATSMSSMVVPNSFSYNPNVQQSFVVDVTGYAASNATITLYRNFSANNDGSYSADYNSRLVAAQLINGQGTVDIVNTTSQYYLLAEVWFDDGTTPIQKRIPNTDTSWIW
ncbi:hypothetical protein [Enterovibrio nigricans]|uniref:Lipoprotein n=1 Tax=Enterovibrio nigricans DSM 22720 TaxID=1121868 RepID=A0A1T4VDK7_9GAMM|nr:hypothetical protein [Enterovibrio nigricans]SKA62641.1 hypothetical protein SAMN02745132_03650 [Enterovibrio nigricans DSM 22720]